MRGKSLSKVCFQSNGGDIEFKGNSSSQNNGINEEEKIMHISLKIKTYYEIIDEIIGEDNIICNKATHEYKNNIVVDKKRYYRIYGNVIGTDDNLYKNVLVRLYIYKIIKSELIRKESDKMFTNLYGEFNFVTDDLYNIEDYRVEIDSFYNIL